MCSSDLAPLLPPPSPYAPAAEVLCWLDAGSSKPDAEILHLLWYRDSDGLAVDWTAGWWDGEAWRDASHGGVIDGDVLAYADVHGPRIRVREGD